jgi:hypothetical protein
MRTAAAARRVLEIVGVGLGAMLAYFVAPLDARLGEVTAVALVLAICALLVPLALRRARQVLASDQPLLVAAQSLFTTMTLLVVSFSAVYYMLAADSEGQMDGIETKIDALYFTVTVLATVGFGDITATGQGARLLVTFQMGINLVLVAIAVRVLSWALTQRQDRVRRVAREQSGISDDPS